jgi:superoxide dismutase, Fe-Mn family
MQATRREALLAVAVGGAALMTGSAAAQGQGKATGAKASAAGKHTPRPLPFDPRKLDGLSERLLVSHHENNYTGAVKNLNKVEEELARVNKDTPGFVVGGLRERELTFTNSMILHELYFGNLGGADKPGATLQKAIADGFGSFARWEELFRATAMSLAGGSGWTVLDYNFHSGDLRTYWAGNHTQALALGHPLLVLDMYEHAFHIDYGSGAAKYVDAFFRNIRWEQVAQRLERAQKAAALLQL